jgi:O-acetylserine/cysteine efflux transporter
MTSVTSSSNSPSVTPGGLLLGVITSFAFGISVVVNKAGLDRSVLPPLDYTALSALVAGILALPPVLVWTPSVLSCSRLCLVKLVAIGVSASGFAYLLLFWGQSLTSATNAGFVLTLTAFFTVVFAAILLGERIERRKYPAIGLLFVGLYLLIVGTEALALNIGDLFIVGTALIWGVTNSIARSVMREISAQLVAWLRLVIGGAFLAVVLRVGPGEAASPVSSGDYWFLGSGVLVWASILLFYKTIEKLGAGMASLVVVSSPVISTIGAVALLGEVLSAEDLIGGGLILLSLLGMTSWRKRPGA